jgi:metal-responsive CopG/Arc/MetJ family transcriptional regulator
MGRKELNVKGVYVWLFEGQPDRVDAAVGKQKRSEFIREAVDEKLARLASELRKREKPSKG